MISLRIPLVIAILVTSSSARAADEPRAPEVDAAVNKALAFLRQSQQREGCWLAAGFGAAQSPGVTGLCVMAFLSAGHTPTEGPHAAAITAGIRWVLRQQQTNGVIGASDAFDMYHHGICTLMLAEVVGATDGALAEEVRQKLVKAVELILRAQRTAGGARGGWRYSVVGADADLSVAGWQLLALRAARNVGC